MSHNDVYLSICLFGQIQKTVLAASIFPIIFYDKLKFEKVQQLLLCLEMPCDTIKLLTLGTSIYYVQYA